ncbi:MAG: hypothetical protein QY331_07660 [Melioribacteraceae bacterium]|nr:MAG: hypothetical protein QY331_07660 [Melioribacteraceae bacterium]
MSLFNKVDLQKKYDSISRGLYKSASTILLEDSRSFSEYKTYDVFLSHSSLDASYILAISEEIKDLGFTVYVDWIEDPALDRKNVNKHTAAKLRERMKNSKSLFYATSVNSSDSKWMPWELGYFDGIKSKVAILPVYDSPKYLANYKGQEYLGLYPFVAKGKIQNKNEEALWIHYDENTYVNFYFWLNQGKQPYKHY